MAGADVPQVRVFREGIAGLCSRPMGKAEGGAPPPGGGAGEAAALAGGDAGQAGRSRSRSGVVISVMPVLGITTLVALARLGRLPAQPRRGGGGELRRLPAADPPLHPLLQGRGLAHAADRRSPSRSSRSRPSSRPGSGRPWSATPRRTPGPWRPGSSSRRSPPGSSTLVLRPLLARLPVPGGDEAAARSVSRRAPQRIFAACAPGLEPALARELDGLGLAARAVAGGAEAEGRDAWAVACLGSRAADAVKARLWEGPARGTRRGPSRSRPGACPAWSSSRGATGDRATLSADAAGAPLFKRGWRARVGAAPLRESLAAGLLLELGFDGSLPVPRPHVRVGHHRHRGGAPGRAAARRGSGAPSPSRAGRATTRRGPQAVRERLAALSRDPPAPVLASDRNGGAVRLAGKNAEAAGMAGFVRIERRDAADVEPPPGPGVCLVNPPYGIRLDREVEESWRSLGSLLARLPGWTVGVLAGDPAAREAASRASRRGRIEVQNGGIRCRFLVYQPVKLPGLQPDSGHRGRHRDRCRGYMRRRHAARHDSTRERIARDRLPGPGSAGALPAGGAPRQAPRDRRAAPRRGAPAPRTVAHARWRGPSPAPATPRPGPSPSWSCSRPAHPSPSWAARLAAATLLGTLFSQALKRSLHRPRPTSAIVGFEALAENPDRFSFPSGHTTAAFAAAVALAGAPFGIGPAALALAVGHRDCRASTWAPTTRSTWRWAWCWAARRGRCRGWRWDLRSLALRLGLDPGGSGIWLG